MRFARIAAVASVAVAATVTGVVVVQGIGPASAAAVAPGDQASTLPVQLVPGTSRSHSSRAQANAMTNATAAANPTSTNWAGYIASGGTYTSVSATWTQPTVKCTSNGIVTLWVGLDGDTDNTVEQTGTGADCRSGSPQYYAWWQTYPTNNQMVYSGVPVAPGDQITATVTYADGNYTMALADTSQNWSKSTTAAAPSGASNASAEVVIEAAGINNVASVLPNFAKAAFSSATMNGGPPTSAGAQPYDMLNNNNALIARTTPTDATGGAFTITYTGGTNVHAAFQSDAGSLFTYSSPGNAKQNLQMAPGTSPAVTTVPGGAETAYQDKNGYLQLTGTSGSFNSTLGMAQGTSPSITTVNGGGVMAALQANTGMLWTYSPNSGWGDLYLGMMPGTSPSITALSGGGYEIAFQANTGMLWVYATKGYTGALYLGMMKNTSPSAGTQPNGQVQIAFQANTGNLWSFPGPGGGADTGMAMAPDTSPSLATAANGDYETAFQSAAGQLMTISASGTVTQPGQPMSPGSSPAITSPASGGYEIAFQSGTDGNFWVTGDAGTVDTQQTEMRGTNPAIAQ